MGSILRKIDIDNIIFEVLNEMNFIDPYNIDEASLSTTLSRINKQKKENKNSVDININFKQDSGILKDTNSTIKWKKFSVECDDTVMLGYVKEYLNALEKSTTSLQYSKWYDEFNNIIFRELSESDGCLFMAAIAFTSPQNQLSSNFIEASKLFAAVKSDLNGGQEVKKALNSVVNNIHSVSRETIPALKQYRDSGSHYANLLLPKTKDGKTYYEITSTASKLKNYNAFVNFFIEKNGKITREDFAKEIIANDRLKIGGSKVSAFLINLISPEYVYSTDGIQIVTVDTHMIDMFFENSIIKIADELADNGTIYNTNDAKTKFKRLCKKSLESSEDARAMITSKINDIIQLDKLPVHAHQLQAFGWTLFRDRKGAQDEIKIRTFNDVIKITKDAIASIEEVEAGAEIVKIAVKALKQIDLKDMSSGDDVINAIGLLSRVNMRNIIDKDQLVREFKNYNELDIAEIIDTKTGEKSLLVSPKNKNILYIVEALKDSSVTISLDKKLLHTISKQENTTKTFSRAMDWIIAYEKNKP